MTPDRQACRGEYLELANRLADTARSIVRRHYRADFDVDIKDDLSPVTIADREVEAAIRAVIEKELPAHGILGEEYGTKNLDAEYLWVIDPIDGTKSFIAGVPLFGTLIALCRRGSPILGVIDQPILGERWLGADGHGTRFNGQKAHGRKCATLAQAMLYTTSPDMYRGDNAGRFARLRDRVRYVRYGADCYAFGLVASGHIDFAIESGLSPYDFCALVPVVNNAGGAMTDWDGGALTVRSGGNVIAAGDPAGHQLAIAALGA